MAPSLTQEPEQKIHEMEKTGLGGAGYLSSLHYSALASHPCGNFSDTSSWTFLRPKGSIGHVFTVCICTENQNQASFSPFGPHKISVPIELTLGHLRYHLTDVPPQPNSPPDYVFRTNQLPKEATLNQKLTWCKFQSHGMKPNNPKPFNTKPYNFTIPLNPRV